MKYGSDIGQTIIGVGILGLSSLLIFISKSDYPSHQRRRGRICPFSLIVFYNLISIFFMNKNISPLKFQSRMITSSFHSKLKT